jgi:hypothetical protein
LVETNRAEAAEATKAALNGSTGQQFNAYTATTNNNAVILGQFSFNDYGSSWTQGVPGGPGGQNIIEQGGYVSAQGGATTVTYSFPVTFPTACKELIISYGSSLGPNVYAIGGQVASLSTFTVTNTDSGTHGFYWWAKGY